MNELIAHVNNETRNIIFSDNSVIHINSDEYLYELMELNNDSYLIKIRDRIYEVTAQKLDNDRFSIVVNGNLFEIEILTALQEKAKKLLEQKLSLNRNLEIKAPMPGMILKIKKLAGDEVKSGEPVIILEAMKMENEVRSPVSGIVEQLFIKEGNPVEKGAKLFVVKS